MGIVRISQEADKKPGAYVGIIIPNPAPICNLIFTANLEHHIGTTAMFLPVSFTVGATAP